MKNQIKNSIPLLASLGTVGGFIADVLTPLAPFTKWLCIAFSILTIVLFILYLKKKPIGQKYVLVSFIGSLIFGSLFLLNGDSKNGVLGDNIDIVSSFQSSMNLVEAELDSITNKIDVLDEKIDEGFSVVEENNKMLEDVSESQYEILTSIESLNNIGDELRASLGISTIKLSQGTQIKSNLQLKKPEYKKLYKYFVHRMMSYAFFMSAKDTHNEKLIKASEVVPNTDIGYYARACLAANKNDYESFNKFIDSSLAVNPKLFIAYNLQGMHNKDIESLNKAFQLEPNSFSVCWNRGDLFYEQFINKGAHDFQLFSNCMKDLNASYNLTKSQDLEINIMVKLWDEKYWSDLKDFLSKIDDKNSLIEYIKSKHGEDLYAKLFSPMFLLNDNNKTIDIEFIQTDFNNEIGKTFFGYFQFDKSRTADYTIETVEGDYIKVDKEKYIAFNFNLPRKPFIDRSSIGSESVTVFVNRADHEDAVYNLRRAKNGGIYSIIAKLEGSYLGPCFEALYISEGIYNPDEFENATVKRDGVVIFD